MGAVITVTGAILWFGFGSSGFGFSRSVVPGTHWRKYPPESGGHFLQSLCNSYILFAPITSGGRRAAIGDILVL